MSNENEVQVLDNTALSLITKAEIDIQISTAKAFPRDLKKSIDNTLVMATLSQEVAENCVYSLPRGSKTLDGPSVRLAEIVVSCFGNIRAGARIIANDGKTVTSQGICHDLETNSCVTIEVKRSILQNEYKNGQRTGKMVTMNEDMQVVTGNAANAIAFRNAVFKTVPAALIDPIFQKVKATAKGTLDTLATRRDKAIKWFNGKSVTNEAIADHFGISTIEQIDLDILSTLSGYKSSVLNDGADIEEIFKVVEPAKEVPSAKVFKQLKDGIKAATVTMDQVKSKYEITPDQVAELQAIQPEIK